MTGAKRCSPPESGNLPGYYAARAVEYERVYEKPERQADLARLRELVPAYFRGRRVLELACGTGYWTALVAPVAAAVLATDVTPAVLEVARAKPLVHANVEFRLADAYALDSVPGVFDGVLAAFWWSHVRREDLPGFLAGVHRRVRHGARVVFLDNRYVQGSSTPVSRTDAAGNTYQRRRLADGSEHQVLKNFPMAAELRRLITAAGGAAMEIAELPHYWMVAYEVARGAPSEHAAAAAGTPP